MYPEAGRWHTPLILTGRRHKQADLSSRTARPTQRDPISKTDKNQKLNTDIVLSGTQVKEKKNQKNWEHIATQMGGVVAAVWMRMVPEAQIFKYLVPRWWNCWEGQGVWPLRPFKSPHPCHSQLVPPPLPSVVAHVSAAMPLTLWNCEAGINALLCKFFWSRCLSTTEKYSIISIFTIHISEIIDSQKVETAQCFQFWMDEQTMTCIPVSSTHPCSGTAQQ